MVSRRRPFRRLRTPAQGLAFPLVGPRVALRPFTLADVSEVHLVYSDPEVMRYVGHGAVQSQIASESIVRQYMAHQQAHGFGFWAVIDRASGEIIGDGGLARAAAGRSRWATRCVGPGGGRGLGSEVAGLCVGAARTLGLPRVCARFGRGAERSFAACAREARVCRGRYDARVSSGSTSSMRSTSPDERLARARGPFPPAKAENRGTGRRSSLTGCNSAPGSRLCDRRLIRGLSDPRSGESNCRSPNMCPTEGRSPDEGIPHERAFRSARALIRRDRPTGHALAGGGVFRALRMRPPRLRSPRSSRAPSSRTQATS